MRVNSPIIPEEFDLKGIQSNKPVEPNVRRNPFFRSVAGKKPSQKELAEFLATTVHYSDKQEKLIHRYSNSYTDLRQTLFNCILEKKDVELSRDRKNVTKFTVSTHWFQSLYALEVIDDQGKINPEFKNEFIKFVKSNSILHGHLQMQRRLEN